MSNIWTELKDKNKLYRNLILLKSYSLSNGQIHKSNECSNVIIQKSIKELLNNDFEYNFYSSNVEFLLAQGIFESYNYLSLTTYGLQYVENLIDDLTLLTEEEVEIVKNQNNQKIINFLEISSKIGTTISPIINLINLLKNN